MYSPEQAQALRDFSGESYMCIASVIRQVYDGRCREDNLPRTERAMIDIFRTMKPNYHGELYRGMHDFNVLAEVDHEGLGCGGGYDCGVGDAFTIDTIASWSKNQEVTERFATDYGRADGLPQTTFYIKEGEGYDIEPHSSRPYEEEVLTPPQTTFEVVSIEDRGCEEYFVELRIVK